MPSQKYQLCFDMSGVTLFSKIQNQTFNFTRYPLIQTLILSFILAFFPVSLCFTKLSSLSNGFLFLFLPSLQHYFSFFLSVLFLSSSMSLSPLPTPLPLHFLLWSPSSTSKKKKKKTLEILRTRLGQDDAKPHSLPFPPRPPPVRGSFTYILIPGISP